MKRKEDINLDDYLVIDERLIEHITEMMNLIAENELNTSNQEYFKGYIAGIRFCIDKIDKYAIYENEVLTRLIKKLKKL